MGSKPVGLSASRIASLIGLNKWTTPLAAWQQIMEQQTPGWNKTHGYILPPSPNNAAIRFGLNFEDAITGLVEKKFSNKIIDRERFYSKQIGDVTLTTHIDGQFEHKINGQQVVSENKTTNAFAFNSVKKEITEALNDDGELENGFNLVRYWGDDLTEQTPQQYQVQCAIQRVCSGSDLVILHALVFEKVQDAYEAFGWEFSSHDLIGNEHNEILMVNRDKKLTSTMDSWAVSLMEMGNLHEFHLPRNERLESAIISAVQVFYENHIVHEIPPEPSIWDDVLRCVPNPMGTIIATPQLKAKAVEYSELTKQLGSTSPLKKRRDQLKVEIMNDAMAMNRAEWTEPPDKMVIIDPNGGEVLASLGAGGFRAKRAQ